MIDAVRETWEGDGILWRLQCLCRWYCLFRRRNHDIAVSIFINILNNR